MEGTLRVVKEMRTTLPMFWRRTVCHRAAPMAALALPTPIDLRMACLAKTPVTVLQNACSVSHT